MDVAWPCSAPPAPALLLLLLLVPSLSPSLPLKRFTLPLPPWCKPLFPLRSLDLRWKGRPAPPRKAFLSQSASQSDSQLAPLSYFSPSGISQRRLDFPATHLLAHSSPSNTNAPRITVTCPPSVSVVVGSRLSAQPQSTTLLSISP